MVHLERRFWGLKPFLTRILREPQLQGFNLCWLVSWGISFNNWWMFKNCKLEEICNKLQHWYNWKETNKIQVQLSSWMNSTRHLVNKQMEKSATSSVIPEMQNKTTTTCYNIPTRITKIKQSQHWHGLEHLALSVTAGEYSRWKCFD